MILHVYDLAAWTRASNLPIFHLAVQVYRLEYFFCSRGIQTCTPAHNKGHVFKESVHLGRTDLTLRGVRTVVQQLRKEWRKEGYRILGRNCQTFAISFCDELGLADCIPPEYRRFSDLEDLRSAAATWTSLVDGAAALMPRGPNLLMGCSIPELGAKDICGHARERRLASGTKPPGTPGSGSSGDSGGGTSPECYKEESVPDIADPFVAGTLRHAVAMQSVAAEMAEGPAESHATKTRRRPEGRGGG